MVDCLVNPLTDSTISPWKVKSVHYEEGLNGVN